MTPNTRRIKELNDLFRTGICPELGRIMVTQGVRELVAAWPLGMIGVYHIVQNFTDFNPDNNPHHENDFGSFEVAGVKCFFKIDCFDTSAWSMGREDPADDKKTCRVMTIMRADEY